MRTTKYSLPGILGALAALITGCSDSTTAPGLPADAGSGADVVPPVDSGSTGMTDSGADSSIAYVEPASCALKDDPGGPGQYNDGCVKREWIKDYAGTYASAKCELSIAVEGAFAATFTIKVLGGAAGPYTIAWEGGSGAGNDSYYRFTTNATFATTKELNFNAGEKVGATDERSVSLRVNGLGTNMPTYTSTYSETASGNSSEVDCGKLLKK